MRERRKKTEKAYLPKNFNPTAQQYEVEKELLPANFQQNRTRKKFSLKLAAALKKWKKNHG